jgi:hypothetical protein
MPKQTSADTPIRHGALESHVNQIEEDDSGSKHSMLNWSEAKSKTPLRQTTFTKEKGVGNESAVRAQIDLMVKDQEANVVEHQWYILTPDQVFMRWVWGPIGHAIVLYSIIAIPFFVSFEDWYLGLHAEVCCNNFYIAFFAVDVIFIIDWILGFFTAFYKEGVLIVDPARVRRQYIYSWCLIDFVSAIPFSWFLNGASQQSSANSARMSRIVKMSRLLRLLRLTRVFKIAKVGQLLEDLQEKFHTVNVGIMRMFKILFFLLVMTHIIGCLFFCITNFANDPEDTWVFRRGISDSDTATKYLHSVYWAFTTLTTVGYGDITAFTPGEIAWSMVTMLVGMTVYGFIVSSITTTIEMIEEEHADKDTQKQNLRIFLAKAKLHPTLSAKIREAFAFGQQRYQEVNAESLDSAGILEVFAPKLRQECIMWMHRSLITKIPFFMGKPDTFVSDVVKELVGRHYSDGELVIDDGLEATEIFFLTSGVVGMYWAADDQPFMALQAGNEESYFGLEEAKYRSVYEYYVRTHTHCVTHVILFETMQMLIRKVPVVKKLWRAWHDTSQAKGMERWRRAMLHAMKESRHKKSMQSMSPTACHPIRRQSSEDASDMASALGGEQAQHQHQHQQQQQQQQQQHKRGGIAQKRNGVSGADVRRPRGRESSGYDDRRMEDRVAAMEDKLDLLLRALVPDEEAQGARQISRISRGYREGLREFMSSPEKERPDTLYC